MPPKRKEKASGRIKWTNQMINDILDCRDRAIEENRSSMDTTSSRGRKGYMEIMKCMWEEKGYASLELSAQNLRDRASYYEKKMELGDLRGTPTEEIEEHNQQDNIISENIEVESIQTISEDICINENANISNQSSTVTIDQPIQNQPEIPNIERRSQVRQSEIISGDTETNEQDHLSD